VIAQGPHQNAPLNKVMGMVSHSELMQQQQQVPTVNYQNIRAGPERPKEQ